MARTLLQLKQSIERLIEQQGENAPVAAFLFTQEDVCVYNEEYEPQYQPIETVEKVLNSIEENDYIYETVFAMIDDELTDLGRIK